MNEQTNMRNPSQTSNTMGLESWSRQAVTFRLTTKRKRGLRALLPDTDEDASPTEALDLAIELALAGKTLGQKDNESEQASNEEIASALDDLRMQTHALASAVGEWAGARMELAQIATECAELRRVLVLARANGPSERVAFDQRHPIPIKTWLDREVDASSSWLVAKISWINKQPAGAQMAVWEVELRELRRSNSAVARSTEAVRVVLGSALASGPLAGLDSCQGAVLSCARSSDGWALSLRSVLEDGSLGESFAQLLI
jgi:hypothetical protein